MVGDIQQELGENQLEADENQLVADGNQLVADGNQQVVDENQLGPVAGGDIEGPWKTCNYFDTGGKHMRGRHYDTNVRGFAAKGYLNRYKMADEGPDSAPALAAGIYNLT